MTVEIALVGHRLAEATPTGIGRYYAGIAGGLAAVADPTRHRFTLASPAEGVDPPWAPANVRLRSLGGPRKLRTLAWNLVGHPTVDRALEPVDIVHVLHQWARVPTRAHLVATVHDLMPLLRPEWFTRSERWTFGRGVRHAVDRADRIVAISAHTADQLVARLSCERDRIRVVWEGVDAPFWVRHGAALQRTTAARYGVEPGRYVMTVGAVSARKNLPVVLRALARTDPGGPALLVAGPPGMGAAEIHAEVATLGLQDRVRFGGFVPHDDLPVLLGASLALLHPSRDEGFGLTPLEAMATGVPAVASDVGSIPEVVGDAAVLADPEDADAWAAAITELATDEDHRTRLIERGDRHVQRFTWERAATETLAVYDEVRSP